MRKILSFIFILTITSLVWSQTVPKKFNYQAVVRNDLGEPVKSSLIGIKITITDGTTTFTELQQVTTNNFGLFTIEIGSVNDLTIIDFSKSVSFMIAVDVNGGTNYKNLLTKPALLLSVPYAIYAEKSNQAKQADEALNYKGVAGGDLKGNFPNPTIDKLQGKTLQVANPADQTFLYYDGTSWSARSLSSLAGDGIVYDKTKGFSVNVNPTQFRIDNDTLKLNKITLDNIPNGTQNTTQVLKWDGTKWIIAKQDTSKPYKAGNGIGITNNVINAKSDTAMWNANKLQNKPIGDLSKTREGQVLSWDGAKWVAKDTTTFDKILPLGTKNVNQILKWNGTNWVVALPDTNKPYTAGKGITIKNNVVNVTPDSAIFNASKLNDSKVGDLSKVSQGQVLSWDGSKWIAKDTTTFNKILPQGTFTNQILKWDGTKWIVATPDSYTAGKGIKITNNVINVTLDSAIFNAKKLNETPIDDLSTTKAGQVLSWDGTKWIAKDTTTFNKILPQGTVTNQILKWDGTKWIVALPDTNKTYTAGNGIKITNNVVNAKSDSAMWNANKLKDSNIGDLSGAKADQVLTWDATNKTWVAKDTKNVTLAQNGLIKNGDTLELGGSLKRSTQLNLNANNLSLMAGKVGINETSPNQDLAVKGTLGISGGSKSYSTFKGASSQAQNIDYTLPSSVGATNSVLMNDGNGNLSWTVNALKAVNGLNRTNDSIRLGGALTEPTIITTDATNTLTVKGDLSAGGMVLANQYFQAVIANAENTNLSPIATVWVYIPAGTKGLEGSVFAYGDGEVVFELLDNGGNVLLTGSSPKVSNTNLIKNTILFTNPSIPSGWSKLIVKSKADIQKQVMVSGFALQIKN